jgi:hypothetical protein
LEREVSASLTLLAVVLIWTGASILLGLVAAVIMRFGLHYKPPGDLPPLPSGSIDHEGLAQ